MKLREGKVIFKEIPSTVTETAIFIITLNKANLNKQLIKVLHVYKDTTHSNNNINKKIDSQFFFKIFEMIYF